MANHSPKELGDEARPLHWAKVICPDCLKQGKIENLAVNALSLRIFATCTECCIGLVADRAYSWIKHKCALGKPIEIEAVKYMGRSYRHLEAVLEMKCGNTSR